MFSKTKRRFALALASTALICALPAGHAQTPRVIKISHQFPAATSEDGDFRDRLVRRFAAEVEKQTKGSLKFEIYPGSSLMKTNSQIGALRKSALDMSLVPLAYGGGEIPAVNLTLMLDSSGSMGDLVQAGAPLLSVIDRPSAPPGADTPAEPAATVAPPLAVPRADLQALRDRCRDLGMAIGLYLDFAVGEAAEGDVGLLGTKTDAVEQLRLPTHELVQTNFFAVEREAEIGVVEGAPQLVLENVLSNGKPLKL